MLKGIKGLLRCERGGSEILAVVALAVLVLLAALGPGKTLMSKVQTKFTNMGTCLDNTGVQGNCNP